ncbi:uncharacterized protein LOC143658984 isoform X3 [Tamandua tetradactyla]|uniref:uncharacterized protein LOC143658984 isoform X3 n=1 Tax=Tamandua tetradactyla TaxID=48850 RepID=UPI004053B3B6
MMEAVETLQRRPEGPGSLGGRPAEAPSVPEGQAIAPKLRVKPGGETSLSIGLQVAAPFMCADLGLPMAGVLLDCLQEAQRLQLCVHLGPRRALPRVGSHHYVPGPGARPPVRLRRVGCRLGDGHSPGLGRGSVPAVASWPFGSSVCLLATSACTLQRTGHSPLLCTGAAHLMLVPAASALACVCGGERSSNTAASPVGLKGNPEMTLASHLSTVPTLE